ncbi:MAG: metallophosphoesterase family protein [Thaumarchaeota archaeon]|nr:MAG: metallophosphoesterase family protein [Nitrososphaerota archaeon]
MTNINLLFTCPHGGKKDGTTDSPPLQPPLIERDPDHFKDDKCPVIYHGTSSSKKEFLIKSGKYDMVICGHTHRKANNKIGRTLVVNPGTAKGWFFGFYSTIAVFNTHSRIIEFVNL